MGWTSSAATGRCQRRRNVLQGLAFSRHPEESRDQPTGNHHQRSEQVTEEQPERLGAVTDEPSVDDRTKRTETLRDGKEYRDCFARTSSGNISLTVR